MKNGLAKREWLPGYLYILPNFLGFAIFIAFPVVWGFFMGFTSYDGFNNREFIGMKNYIKLFSDEYFLISFKNNLVFTCTSVPLTIFFALLLALALNRGIFMTGTFKTVFFFPTITSMVAVAIVWTALFNPNYGPINSFLMGLGIKEPPGWLVSSKWAMVAVVCVVVWKGTGYYMVMLLAGLQTIPNHLYESAEIDGANEWHKFKHVTMPMLSPTMFLVTILAVIGSFQVFDVINIMTGGGPGRSTNVLVYRIYEEAFKHFRFGYASSIAYVLFLMIFIVTIVQFSGQKKWVNYMQ